MNRLESAILRGLQQLIDANKTLPVRVHEPGVVIMGETDDEYHRRLALQEEATYNLASLLGHIPSDSERVMASRALKRLATAGYVVRLNTGYSDVTTALRLLPAGRAAIAPASQEGIANG